MRREGRLAALLLGGLHLAGLAKPRLLVGVLGDCAVVEGKFNVTGRQTDLRSVHELTELGVGHHLLRSIRSRKGDAAAMVFCKKQFTESGKASQSSGSKGGGVNQTALGSAAPTATVANLICVKVFEFKDRVRKVSKH